MMRFEVRTLIVLAALPMHKMLDCKQAIYTSKQKDLLLTLLPKYLCMHAIFLVAIKMINAIQITSKGWIAIS